MKTVDEIMVLVDGMANAEHHQNDGQALYFRSAIEAEARKEPTDAMLKAAVIFLNGNAVYKNVSAEVLEIEEQIYAEVYKAMIAAAKEAK